MKAGDRSAGHNEGHHGMPRTLVVIPALNEEDSLPTVLRSVAVAAPDLDVLVVDDGSTDRTAAVAREAGVVVASLPFNLGVGGALRTGFRYALRHDYERVIQLDGDGQHPPKEITKLIDALDDGAQLVVGSRFAHATSTYRVGRTRRGGMRLLQLLVAILHGERLTDTSSGFRAFDRSTVMLFARDYPVEYLGDTVEALLVASYAGLRIQEVPVDMRPREAGRPSVRNAKLFYHYVRLLLMIVFTASLRGRRSRSQDRRARTPEQVIS
jgi:glycosyltransferase involved in cell wall biosynthesis